MNKTNLSQVDMFYKLLFEAFSTIKEALVGNVVDMSTALVGNVIDMSTTCLQQAQMSKNSKNNSSVVDMDFFHVKMHKKVSS